MSFPGEGEGYGQVKMDIFSCNKEDGQEIRYSMSPYFIVFCPLLRY